jgi:hypothetical protein
MEITKYRSQLFAASEQAMVYLRQAQNTLTRLGRTVADKPRRLQEALRARENDLLDLLVSSLDPNRRDGRWLAFCCRKSARPGFIRSLGWCYPSALPISFLLCFEHVDNLGAYRIWPETGLLKGGVAR